PTSTYALLRDIHPTERASDGRASSSSLRKFSSRQKSCLNCVRAKARCDLDRPVCGKCQEKRLECSYLNHDTRPAYTMSPPKSSSPAAETSAPSTVVISSPSHAAPRSVFPLSNLIKDDNESVQSADDPPSLSSPPTPDPPIPIHDEIGSRWLNALITPFAKTPKYLSRSTADYMGRILESYARVVLHEPDAESMYDALPPFIHPRQAINTPRLLANCRSLLRMFENRAPGSEVEEASVSLATHRAGKYDQHDLLSACQAYLIYSIHLFFCLDTDSSAMVDTVTTINLQELSSAIAMTGLQAIPNGSGLSWQAWITAEAKRRTVYTMYMFDNVYSFTKGTASYIATELGQLPLPACKTLWEARTEAAWQAAQHRFVLDWQTLGLPVLEDLWPHQDKAVAARRKEKVDKWVESVDELGMFLFSTTSMTYPS
ncbi:hypothetical protein C8F01DRAFT_1305790, partial [Mycena amicta]